MGHRLLAEETVIHNSSGQAIAAEIIEGVFEVLETIRKDGYKVAMIANADSVDARNVIASCGLENYFDAIGYYDKVMENGPEKILEFPDWMGIPIEPHGISLNRLKNLLLDQIKPGK